MGSSLGRRFGWLWASFAVSAYGTGLGFGALLLIAIEVLHAGPARVSALTAVGAAVGALLAVPLGPWMEFRRKRPVMITMDLCRFATLASIPVAYLAGVLSFAQLLVVAIVSAAADITFRAASGAFLKTLVPPGDLLAANVRFESTTWSAQSIGPPLGGAAMGVFGPVVTAAADAVSYLLSALGIGAIGGGEPVPDRGAATGPRLRELLEGWRHILGDPGLRGLLASSALFGGLLLATEPLLAVLMVGELGFAPWQYGLALAGPCVGGLLGARLSPPLTARFGSARVLRVSATARACWPIALAFVGPGPGGVALVAAVQFGMIVCIGVANPLVATYRLHRTPLDRAARTLSAWTITTRAGTAALTALWGLLAAAVGARVAIGLAGVLVLITPLLLPRREYLAPTPAYEAETAGSGAARERKQAVAEPISS